MRILITLLFLSGILTVFGQTIRIIDHTTKEPIPFVRISPIPGVPILGSIDGSFTIPAGTERIQLKAATYRDTIILVSQIGEIIELEPLAGELEEFIVLPGVNPAERIMEMAINNRKKNHPMEGGAFTCDTYNKFTFTANPEAFAQMPDTTMDSTLMAFQKVLDKQYLFMMESTVHKSFEPPYREKEVITAYKISGFSNPEFLTLTKAMESVDFYDNQIELMEGFYVTPLAAGSIRRYSFILEDTTIVGTDTTFTIRFQPRKGRDFNGMKGWLYINTNGFALEKVIAEPSPSLQTIQPKIVQEYVLVDAKKWFPSKLEIEVVFSLPLPDSSQNIGFVAKGSIYTDHVVVDADLSEQRRDAITMETAPDAADKDSTYWNNHRKYQLTDKEAMTYKMVDSFARANHLQQKLDLLSGLINGKIPLGYVQLDIKHTLDFNEFEGARLGLGLENSEKLWKRAVIGGYFGYGTHDKAWKYGGYARYLVFLRRFVEVQGLFQHDVLARGFHDLLAKSESFNINTLPNFYLTNMEYQRKMELSVSGYLLPAVKLLGSANYQRIWLTDGYAFNHEGKLLSGESPFDLAELNLEVVWKIREKFMCLGTKRISLGSRWPEINASLTQGIPAIARSVMKYTRVGIAIQQDVSIRGAGNFSYLVRAGKTFGEVPLFLNHVSAGTRGSWSVSIPNTFETMPNFPFYTTQYVNVFTRFTFHPIKTRVEWSTPQIVVHHAVGVGSFNRSDLHTTPVAFKSMDKGYFEAGILLNKLMNRNYLDIGYFCMGIGYIYNYGYYSNADWRKNGVPKISFSFQLK